MNFTCLICYKKMGGNVSGRHLKYKHNLDAKKYYKQFIDGRDTCIKCGINVSFISLSTGYQKYCRSCAAKTEERNKKLMDSVHRNGTYDKMISNIHKIKGWSKGLTKENCESLAKMGEKITKIKTGTKLSPETKKKISESHLKRNKTLEAKKQYKEMGEKRKGKNNPRFKRSEEDWKISYKKQSETMKKKILSGEFTPCVTNSWANSRCKIEINGFDKRYRSSWDAVFQILNPNCKYEKIRIPYKLSNNEWHNYIVDFIDEENKFLYEIKPFNSVKNKLNNIKFKFAVDWATENKHKFIIIDDNWFKKNAKKIQYSKYDPKLLKGMRQFL